MSTISITGAAKAYGSSHAVRDFNLAVEDGELVVFLGPSGCGKTTMLRMIAGFVEPTGGSIRIGEREMAGLPPHARNIGVVFQNYALFPHMTVSDNVAFGLHRRKVAKPEVARRVTEALEMVHMGHLAARMPAALSGGQQQRVAIARAIVVRPDVLLLDEPLSNLDAKLRLSIRQELRRLQKTVGITTILVTHDQEEAMSIADRLVVMSDGVIQQVGTPEAVYARPANGFVADFIGGANFLAGSARDGAFQSAQGRCFIQPRFLRTAGPWSSGPSGSSLRIRWPPQVLATGSAATVSNATFLGSGRLLEVRLETGEMLNVLLGGREAMRSAEVGEAVTLCIRPSDIYCLRDSEPGATR